jgi:hypothetical protein
MRTLKTLEGKAAVIIVGVEAQGGRRNEPTLMNQTARNITKNQSKRSL